MNQEQAKKLVSLAEEIGWAYFDSPTRDNKEHIVRFADAGAYQCRDDGKHWVTRTSLIFDCSPEHYRPVPERKINWEKAMKNGAWGQNFIMWDSGDVPHRVFRLCGFVPEREHPFLTDDAFFGNCNPLPGFKVPESWLEDEDANR